MSLIFRSLEAAEVVQTPVNNELLTYNNTLMFRKIKTYQKLLKDSTKYKTCT